MAGGKKKSLASKLAKMSDEERARYLQHKADMEEEAKRRKEQLIATFMKKKIRKEDAFSRLNIAKINQNWHQILRRTKCQEMKQNVEHLKTWIERLLDYKNRTISKLMDELEEAEDQYSHNFQCHSTHIEGIIENQHEYIEKLQEAYDEDLLDLLETAYSENDTISKNTQKDQEYLKTVLCGQDIEGEKSLKQQYEAYAVKLYETENEFQKKLSKYQRSRDEMSGAIWRQIASVVRLYVQHTDSRRMHFAELQRSDAESASEIAENEERIRSKEELIIQLEKDYENMSCERELIIKKLEIENDDLNKQFLRVKKDLHRDLEIDEKQLHLLAECGANALQYLQKLAKKGDYIKYLATTCKKFETEREKISKWLPVTVTINKYEGDDLNFEKDVNIVSEQMKNIGNIKGAFLSIEDCALPVLKLPKARHLKKTSARPRTAVSHAEPKSAHSFSTTTPESKRIETVNQITIIDKESKENDYPSPVSSTEKFSDEVNILDRCFESLKHMENFWFIFNKVEIEFSEMKVEKRALEEENKQLRGMIRAVLESACLSRNIVKSGVSTRLPSRRRTAHSAPLRRVVI